MAGPNAPKAPSGGASSSPSTSSDARGLTPTGTRDKGLFHPPVLTARCYNREIEVPASFNEFDAVLKQWIATCVTSRTRDPRLGAPAHREQDLVGGNRSVKDVWGQIEALRPRGSRTGPKVRIYANYQFFSAGGEEWGVSSVQFSVRDLPAAPRTPRPPPPPSHDYSVLKRDIAQGEKELGRIVDEAHGAAKGVAPMPAVTVQGKDLLMDAAKGDEKSLAKNIAKGYLQDLYRSNMAYDITKRRGELYDAYVDGALSVLMPNYGVNAKRSDPDAQAFFDRGKKRVTDMAPERRRQLMLAAVEAVRVDPTAPGSWFVAGAPLDWTADDYEKHIKEPGTVRNGLTKVFHTPAALIDAP